MFKRDKILLEEPSNKRSKQRQEEDDFLQPSDEEVLGYSASSSDTEDDLEEDDEGGDADMQDEGGDLDDDDDAVDDDGTKDEIAAWGNSKAAYYNTDKITNEEEARMEEEEAKRLQQKRLKSLREEDFGFDEAMWAGDGGSSDDEARGKDDISGVVREKLPQLHITPDMTDADKLKLLRRRYPEFEGYAKELLDLQPVWEELKKDYEDLQADSKRLKGMAMLPSASLSQYRALSAYLGSLTMYFALLTSPANRNAEGSVGGQVLPMVPQDLREHDVQEYIQQCKDAWESVIDLEDDSVIAQEEMSDPQKYELQQEAGSNEASVSTPKTIKEGKAAKKAQREASNKQQNAEAARLEASKDRRKARAAKVEASLRDMDTHLADSVKVPRSKKRVSANGDHDLGDEAPLDAQAAAEKAQRKKSLRFYTSRIAQKANKDERAAQVGGGDEDLPYRERYRDRVERLNREAEARGRKGRREPISDDDGGSEDVETTNAQRETVEGDDDYRELMGQVHAKKERKRQREAAYQEARDQGGQVAGLRQVEIGPDGRRQISYAIAKNKGLAPRKKKEIRNPRVKKRMRYEDKKKKLKSMKPVYSGSRVYSGEGTGIKSNLVKSTKF